MTFTIIHSEIISLHRQICHLSTADLPTMWEDDAASKCFMANKFNLNVDPVAVLCQAKDIVQKTEDIIDKNAL